MTAVVTCVVEPELDAAVAAALLAAPGLTLARRCVDLADLLAVARTRTATVAVVSASLRRFDAAALSDLAGCGLAVVGLVADEAQERRFRQWGAAVVSADAWREDPDVLATAIAELDAAPSAAVTAAVPDVGVGPSGLLVAVWGPAGAPGRSTVAANLAAEAALAGRSVMLVDADPFAGSLAQQLGVTGDSPGLLAAVRAANHGTLDLPLLSRLAPEVSPGLRLLAGGPAPHRTPLPIGGAEGVWNLARRLVDLVVVDCGWPLSGDDIASLGERAIAEADQVVAVGTADPIGLTRLLQGLPDLTAASAAPTRLVVNRVRRGPLPGSPRPAIERALSQWHGKGPDRLIPQDPAVDAAVLAGRPLCDVAPRSAARSVLAELAADLVQSAVAAAPSRSASASLRRRIARSSGSFSVAMRPSITKKTAE